MSKEMIVEDIVSGIIGMFVRTEIAQEFRLYVFYKEANAFGFWGKEKRIQAAIPKDGMIEVPGTACMDGRARLFIFSYGDEKYHPVIPMMMNRKIDDAIIRAESMSITAETKSAALQTEKTVFERSKDELVKKAIDQSNQMNRPPQPKQPLFRDVMESE